MTTDAPHAMDPRIEALLPLPHLSTLVLLALGEGDAHGWAIIRRIRELEGASRTPSSGSLYVAMLRLEEKSLLEETEAPQATEDDDARRRYYRLTAFGRRVLEAEMERLARLVEHGRRSARAVRERA
jgi:DNA-binding PadR family transcriptional regulator